MNNELVWLFPEDRLDMIAHISDGPAWKGSNFNFVVIFGHLMRI